MVSPTLGWLTTSIGFFYRKLVIIFHGSYGRPVSKSSRGLTLIGGKACGPKKKRTRPTYLVKLDFDASSPAGFITTTSEREGGLQPRPDAHLDEHPLLLSSDSRHSLPAESGTICRLGDRVYGTAVFVTKGCLVYVEGNAEILPYGFGRARSWTFAPTRI